jgi:hypothetical protein
VEDRDEPFLVIGERHFTTQRGLAPDPHWLRVPQRGLYTGVMVVGAVGTGKTSAALYPFTDQLLRWRADDGQRKVGGLVLEVKGDFCGQVRDILTRAGRGDDYVEISLGGNISYNPLHNDLDPYALAYAIGSLLNNLHGRSKEPFWQQAYTDLVKFVILLRRLSQGYTTLADVYRTILDESHINLDLERLSRQFAVPPEVVIIRTEDYETHCASDARWSHWFVEDLLHQAHPYDAGLETYLAGLTIPFVVRGTQSEAWQGRKQQWEAVNRWYKSGWSTLDARLRSSIRSFARSRTCCATRRSPRSWLMTAGSTCSSSAPLGWRASTTGGWTPARSWPRSRTSPGRAGMNSRRRSPCWTRGSRTGRAAPPCVGRFPPRRSIPWTLAAVRRHLQPLLLRRLPRCPLCRQRTNGTHQPRGPSRM